MSAYDELIARCNDIADVALDVVPAVLAEVRRTLEAWSDSREYDCSPGEFKAMLHASPLVPPK